jgi:hypothetical protein
VNKRKIIIRDITLVLLLVLISLSALLVRNLTAKEGSFVRISKGGSTLCTLPLDIDTTYRIGETNTVCIEGGRVYMSYADCPDGLCEKQGKIHLSGERIICLPNLVVVEVVGDEPILGG